MKLKVDIDLDPHKIAEDLQNDELSEFILELNGAIADQDFTIQLALDLLKLWLPTVILNRIKKLLEVTD